MNIGVISDSHDNIYLLRKIIKEILDYHIELIIHLGDIISPFTVKLMKDLLGDTRLIGVRGNNDGDIYQLTRLFTKYNWVFLSEPGIIEIGDRKVLLLHGYGDLENTRKLVESYVKSPLDIDAVFYGHTHVIHVEKIGNKLIVNPGEVCGYLTNKASYSIVNLDKLEAEIHVLGVLHG